MTRQRTQSQMDRIRARKTERKLANIPPGQNNKGRSLAKVMQDELDQSMSAWMLMRKIGDDGKAISKARGVVRGYALSLAIILRPYDDRVTTAKLIEKASMERIRENGN